MLYARLAALALATSALATSGCGGSSKPSSTAATATAASTATNTTAETKPSSVRLTRAQWLPKAKAICTQVHSKLSSITVHSAKELTNVAPQIIAFEQTAVSEMKGLTPPAKYSSDWQSIIAGLQQLSEDTAKYSQATAVSDRAAVNAAATSERAAHQRTAVGLVACTELG